MLELALPNMHALAVMILIVVALVMFAREEIPRALERVCSDDGVDEAVILSTCNRVEVLARVRGTAGAIAVQRFLRAAAGVSAEELNRHTYHYKGPGAVRHLFQVAAGLDSMIVGEQQILGQVKQAYLLAKRTGSVGPLLDRLFQHCLAAAKRARTETGISRNAVSVAFAAVGLARNIFGDLKSRKALLLGADDSIGMGWAVMCCVAHCQGVSASKGSLPVSIS